MSAARVRFVAWILLLLLALFPVLAAATDLISDFGAGLPTDHSGDIHVAHRPPVDEHSSGYRA